MILCFQGSDIYFWLKFTNSQNLKIRQRISGHLVYHKRKKFFRTYPPKWLKWKRWKIPSVSKDTEPPELPYFWWKCKLIQPFWKTVWQYLLKCNICILQPRNSSFIISPTDMCTFVHQWICTRMFLTAQFIIPLNWKIIQMSINSKMYI